MQSACPHCVWRALLDAVGSDDGSISCGSVLRKAEGEHKLDKTASEHLEARKGVGRGGGGEGGTRASRRLS